MYAPTTFNGDLYSLWNKRRVPELVVEASVAPAHPHRPDQGSSADSAPSHLRQLFAPPLAAYSPDYYGANTDCMEYTIQSAVSRFGHTHKDAAEQGPRWDFGLMSPLMLLKSNQLKAIRDTGYTTIRPIGIGRTQQELDVEAGVRRRERELELARDDRADDVNESASSDAMGVDGADLDDAVATADNDDDAEEDSAFYYESHEEDDDLALPRHQNIGGAQPLLQRDFRDDLVQEGFMASEVEYQADHSLDASLHHHDSSMISPVYTAFSGAATASTLMTSVHSNPTPLECIGEDTIMDSAHETSGGDTSVIGAGSSHSHDVVSAPSRVSGENNLHDYGVDENNVEGLGGRANDFNADEDASNIDDSDMVMI